MSDTPAKPAEQAGELEPAQNVAKLEPEALVNFRQTVEWLADQSESERSYWLPKKAEALGATEKELRLTVARVLRERAMKNAAQRLEEDRAARQRAEVAAEERREHDRRHKTKRGEAVAAERKQRRIESKAEREQRKAEKEAERKNKEKAKSFANTLKLPVDRHDGELTKLATRLGEDLEVLRQEFKDFAGVADGFSTASEGDVESWPEAVDTAALLQNVDDKIGKYIVLQPHQRTGVVLWAAMSWVHNAIATYSPVLTATSAEPGAGKTELLAVLTRLAPKPSMNVETTGPNVYRYVDAHKPTLILDEADDLFTRKSDLKHIINASWTRGTTIPRQVSINGVWVTVRFDPFCPKALGLLGRNLPRTLKTRGIEIRMQPKRADEVVEPFTHTDDLEFAVLRQQLARFASDNAAVLKSAQPTMPSGLNNRAAANWKLLFAIAELAGGVWPQQAREAAERLSRSGRQPSDSVRLLETFRKTLKRINKPWITSEDAVTKLCENPLDIWATYNKGGRITQRQVAVLLDPYDIHPVSLHPTQREDYSRQGYKREQFADAFARYLPTDPIIQSPQPTKAASTKRRSTKPTKRKRARRG